MPKRRRDAESTMLRRGDRLRIIGGRMRGRRFVYHGDPTTRPMKQRVREATFNLIGPAVKGKLAIDLFAGTGALGFEALSRGAAGALFVERHLPTARVLEQNIADLGVAEVSQVAKSDTFFWARDLPHCIGEGGDHAWLAFCSPPWALFHEQWEEMSLLIERIIATAPPDSLLVVETDANFDLNQLPHAASWDARSYDPAVIAVLEIPVEAP